ncbi:TauD/TfdA family dioxygenase [Fulvivirga ligni]|uniref:TauD/TfdA family dioxygenase n=1 Tax=Fulvivirga ligni TaxID=2904246 RepID=UPI001F20E1AF|nr:TauD/TfdA family dioxygenase [Fulvivirga ligni]UII23755.1 TauD/TfdA family dioxygenase [Fulvivirga ligni]
MEPSTEAQIKYLTNLKGATTFDASDHFPFMIKPKGNANALLWAKENSDELNKLLLQHGALLLRGFEIGGAETFNKMFSTISGDAMAYNNRTSPREQVYSNVYTSTSHPNDQNIYMHTENSYSSIFNRIIAFYCLKPANVGGETPIADERKLLAGLKKSTIEKFREKGIQYVRNSMPGIGLDWKTIYQTNDRQKVNDILTSNGHHFTWVSDEHLRVKWSLPAFHQHPLTSEDMWFNHMYFGHKSLYDPAVLEFFSEEDLPFVTYYGDGSDIEPDVIKEFHDFYESESIVFKWEQDDFLLLDNLMFSHGRKPFQGERTILTAMGQPYQMDRNI